MARRNMPPKIVHNLNGNLHERGFSPVYLPKVFHFKFMIFKAKFNHSLNASEFSHIV